MPSVDDDLDLSRSLLGTTEDPAGSNHNFITDWYADRIGDNGFRHAPWCAMSRSYTFDHTGGDLSYAYCPFIERDARAGVNGLEWLAMNAEVGAWVLFDFVGNGYATHVGHVEAVNGDGTIITLEGNIGDAYRREHRDFKYVRGFVRPPFDAPPPPEPDPQPDSPKPPEEDMPPAPAIVIDKDGHELVFVRGTDGKLWFHEEGQPVDGWPTPPEGGILTSGPAATVKPDGTVVVVVRGGQSNGAFSTWRIARDPKGKWGAWESLGGNS